MTKKEYKKLFKLFLKSQGVWDDFRVNFPYGKSFFIEIHPVDWIAGAFTWNDSKLGSEKWWEINDLWLKIV